MQTFVPPFPSNRPFAGQVAVKERETSHKSLARYEKEKKIFRILLMWEEGD